MTAPTPTTGPRWWEVAGAAHAIVQIIYILIALIAASTLWMIHLEVANTHTNDQFAVIETRRAERLVEREAERHERQLDREEEHRELKLLHDDMNQVHLVLAQQDAKIDQLLKGRR